MTDKKTAGSVPATSTPPSNRKQRLDEVAVKTLEHLQTLEETGNITFPPNYSKENAVKGAMLFLAEAADKDGIYLIDKCTLPSIANSIMAMCIDGLSIWKKQGYFIPYKNKATDKFELKWQPDYRGHILLARRDADVKEVNAQCIYEGDEFQYEVDITNGRQRIIKHALSLDNQDIAKIKGAYAVVVFNDGSTGVEIMTIVQLKQAWMMGATKGDSPAHKGFTDRMCRRTVINRATNNLIGSSDDSEIISEDDQNRPVKERDEAIKERSGKKQLDIHDTTFEEVNDNVPKEQLEQMKEAPGRQGNLSDLENEARHNEHSGSHSAEQEDKGPGEPGY